MLFNLTVVICKKDWVTLKEFIRLNVLLVQDMEEL